MQNMNFMYTDTASELAELIAKRDRLQKKLEKCTRKLGKAMTKFATQCTGVAEGHRFSFKGKPALLSGWAFNSMPKDLGDVPGCIEAYIRTDAPDFINGPEYFRHSQLSATDFSADYSEEK